MTTTPAPMRPAAAGSYCIWLTVDDLTRPRSSSAVIAFTCDADGTWQLALYEPDAAHHNDDEPFATLDVPAALDASVFLSAILAALRWQSSGA